MRDFTICIGTTFVFGRDAETKVGDELGAKGVSRVLIHHVAEHIWKPAAC